MMTARILPDPEALTAAALLACRQTLSAMVRPQAADTATLRRIAGLSAALAIPPLHLQLTGAWPHIYPDVEGVVWLLAYRHPDISAVLGEVAITPGGEFVWPGAAGADLRRWMSAVLAEAHPPAPRLAVGSLIEQADLRRMTWELWPRWRVALGELLTATPPPVLGPDDVW